MLESSWRGMLFMLSMGTIMHVVDCLTHDSSLMVGVRVSLLQCVCAPEVVQLLAMLSCVRLIGKLESVSW